MTRVVRALAVAGLALACSSTREQPEETVVRKQANLLTPAVLAFDFDEGSGASLVDDTGNGHTGTLDGQVWVPGRFGSGLRFDENAVTVADTADLDLTTGMTLSAWVWPDIDHGNWPTIVLKEDEGMLAYSLYAGFGDTPPAGAIFTNAWHGAFGTQLQPSRRWTHLSTTYDGAELRLYVDGELASSEAVEGSIVVSSGALRIGNNDIWGGQAFLGIIDELRIYDHALSEAEIRRDVCSPVSATSASPIAVGEPDRGGSVSGAVTLKVLVCDPAVASVRYSLDGVALGPAVTIAPFSRSWDSTTVANGSHTVTAEARDGSGTLLGTSTSSFTVSNSLVAAYAFEDGGGSVLSDETGNGHEGALDEQTWVPGKFGGALRFDGTFVTVEDSELLDLKTSMTLSAWVKPEFHHEDWPTVVIKEGWGTLAYALYDGWGDTPATGEIVTDALRWVTGTELPRPERWTHLSTTYDGSTLRLYVNGALVSSNPSEGAVQSTPDPLRIGGNNLWGQYFYGLIDEVRIYNYARSPAGVLQDLCTSVDGEHSLPLLFSAPAEGARASNSVDLGVVVCNPAVARVRYLVDGAPVGPELTSAPFASSWNSRAVANGSHTVSAEARDAAGTLLGVATTNVIVNNAVVAAYAFDEADGIVLPDVTGNGNDGVLDGQAWVPGRFGSALRFDGTEGAFVNVPDSDSLDLTNGMTLSAWVRPSAERWGAPVVVLKETWPFPDYALYSDSRTETPFSSIFTNAAYAALTPEHRPYGRWRHLATTYDGSALRMYVDGELEATTPATGTIAVTSADLRIGGSWEWSERAMDGLIDELRIYNYALSDAQVRREMCTPVSAGPALPLVLSAPEGGDSVSGVISLGVLLCDPTVARVRYLADGAPIGPEQVNPPFVSSWNSTLVANGAHVIRAEARNAAGTLLGASIADITVNNQLVAAYAFDEGAGDIVPDETGNGQDGTIDGQTWVDGRFGGALRFDGTDGRFVTVEDSALLRLTTGMTLSAWVKPSVERFGASTIVMKENWPFVDYALYGDSRTETPFAGIFTTDKYEAFTPTHRPIGRWTHLTATYDGSALRVYVDGKLEATTPGTGSIFVSRGPLRIGGNAAWPERAMAGLIDEVRVYNYALTNAEVQRDLCAPIGAAVPSPIAFSGMEDGDTISSRAELEVLVCDPNVASVTYLVDGVPVGPPRTQPPFKSPWYSNSVGNGAHVFTAQARDAQGNVLGTSSVEFTVNNGLVAAYDFDEGTGSILSDRSGNGHDGVLDGQTWVEGKFGGALNFGGTFVTVEDSALLHLNTGMTLSAWVKPNSRSFTEPSIVMKENWPFADYALYGDSHFNPPFAGLHTNEWYEAFGTQHPSPDGWTHLTTTYDGNALRVYVDGELQGTTPVSGSLAASGGPLRIGGNQPWDQEFYGAIDEVRVYNYALPEPDVRLDVCTPVGAASPSPLVFAAPAPGLVASVVGLQVRVCDAAVARVRYLVDGVAIGLPLTSAPFATTWNSATVANGAHVLRAEALDSSGVVRGVSTVNVTVSNELVAAYSFDAGSGSVLADDSGNGHDGGLDGQNWVDGGKFGGALHFDGTFVTVEDSDLLDLTNGLTISAWVKPFIDHENWPVIVMKEADGRPTYAFYAGWADSPPLAEAVLAHEGGWVWVAGTKRQPTNRWSFLSTTYDGATLRLYVDGALQSSVSAPGKIDVSSGRLRIGGNTIWTNEPFHGLIDELRIYNYALSQTAIQRDLCSSVSGGTASVLVFRAPEEGAYVSSRTTFDVVTCHPGIAGVQYLVDGVPLGAAETSAPFGRTWDSTSVPNGPHVLRAEARDAGGTLLGSATVNITVNNGLVAAYGFETGTGSILWDDSGNGHDGLLDGQSWVPGKFGVGLEFNGSHVTVQDSERFDLEAGMTVSAWVKPLVEHDDWPTIVMKEDWETPAFALYGGWEDSPPLSEVVLASGGWFMAAGTSPQLVGSWTHLATTYDGAELRFYVNGDLASSVAAAGSIARSTGELVIGGNTLWPNQTFRGVIDELRVYNYPRTQAQIQATFNSPVGCVVPVDDGNPCTIDGCTATGQSTHTPAPNGTGCDDGSSCTSTDTCQSGVCVGSGSPGTNDSVCDGVDSDCDGQIDENYVPQPVVCGAGACRRSGMTVCASGSEIPNCTPGTPLASADTSCNGVDDDCDGPIDEDHQSTDTTCGTGACAAEGQVVCTVSGPQDSCVPGAPTAANDASCNGVDDDCDGSVDENFVSTSTQCGAGVCRATGATSCVNGAVVDSCNAGTAAGSDSVCDGIDADCDGSVDEDYAPHNTTCGVGACRSTGQTSCVNGVEQNSCAAGAAAANDAICDGIDNDCNGQADEDYVPVATSCGVGGCHRNGTTTCAGGVVEDDCDPGTPAPSDTSCDGVDQDCNGTNDEDYASVATSCGVGACRATGSTTCSAGQVVNSCTAGTPVASTDTTCDGVDQDCNGTNDEDYVSVATSCGVGACRASGSTTCTSGQVSNSCAPGTPAPSDTSCDGVDQDCNGTNDEDYVSVATTCGVGACHATGSTSCSAGQVVNSCSAGTPASSDASCDGVDQDCNGTNDEDYVSVAMTCGVGACQASGTTSCSGGQVANTCVPRNAAPNDASCNGIDDDCDGTKDEDYASTPTTCGVGACRSTGAITCTNGTPVNTCTPGAATGTDNDCDSVDDDCDGSADEAFVTVCQGTSIRRCVGGAFQNTDCTDSNPCNGQEQCSAAVCVAGTPPPTSDGNPCTIDRCDPGAGVVHEPAPVGTACGAGLACSAEGTCIGLPVITSPPQSLTVDVGQPIPLGVTASGASLSYQWRRLGRSISGANAATYVAPAAELADDGVEFTVAVSNAAGTVVSAPAVVSVRDASGPIVVMDGPAQRETQQDLVTVTGTVTDSGSGVERVFVRSSAFSQELGALVDAGTGAFSAEVPLKAGSNTLTLVARDRRGNETQRSLIVTFNLGTLPILTITEPATGTRVAVGPIAVRGVVRTTLKPEAVRLTLGGAVVFPTGSNGEYSFEFEAVHLVAGPNVLTVRAETSQGAVSAQTVVTLGNVQTEPGSDPVIRLEGAARTQFIAAASVPVQGTVTASTCVELVTVNGAEATITGQGSTISFSKVVALPPGEAVVPIAVAARDCDDRVGQAQYSVIHDDAPPVLTTALTADTLHVVTSTPYTVSGTITETNLAGFSANQQSIGVLPGANGTWDFSFLVPLVRGATEDVRIEAWDHAGNRSQRALSLKLETPFEIEVITPQPGAEFATLESTTSVGIVARIQGLATDQVVVASVDGGALTVLAGSGGTFTGNLSVPGASAAHELTVAVRGANGAILTRKVVPFSVKNAEELPLEVVFKEPLPGTRNVEANQPVVFEFTRPIDAAQLEVSVRETVRGKAYRSPPAGAPIVHLSDIQLIDVNRDDAAVSGGTSYLPGDRLVAFYPAQDYGYGGTVNVIVRYQGTEIARSKFDVRPLPTLITGFIADQFYNPVEGLEVTLAGTAATAVTNRDGVFSFGFGTFAASIPGGRQKLIVNPGLKDRRYGVIEQWVHAQEGRLKDAGVVRTPVLDGSEPFRRIASRQAEARLLEGKLVLDLSGADLLFANGQSAGDVHAQIFIGPELGYPAVAGALPKVTYALQPMGTEVSGGVRVDLAIPSEADGGPGDSMLLDWVLLSGLDPDSLEIVPVGVGAVNKTQRRIQSQGALPVRRLDFISMTPLPTAAAQTLLSRCASGQLTVQQLVTALQAL